jgi:cyclase
MLLSLGKRTEDIQKEINRAVDSEAAAIPQARLTKVRKEILRLRALPATSVDVAVTSTTELAPGGLTYFLRHPGPGHTDGDMMLHVVDDKVLLAGDLLTVRTLPNLANGYTSAWIERLHEIEKMNIEFIIPGHGPLGTKEDVRALREYLESLRTLVGPIVANGGTSRDLVEKLRVPAAFSSWSSEDLWFPATLRVFHELQGNIAPPSSPSR